MSRVIHFEMPADNPERVIQFYEKTFGWRFDKWDGPIEYWLISTGSEDQPGIDGGLARRTDSVVGIENTIDIKNLEISLIAVEANGGELSVLRWPFPGLVGWLISRIQKGIFLD